MIASLNLLKSFTKYSTFLSFQTFYNRCKVQQDFFIVKRKQFNRNSSLQRN